MSPTSYQTAPPREGIIAEAAWFVKRGLELGPTSLRKLVS
jgi:hypothetical protein